MSSTIKNKLSKLKQLKKEISNINTNIDNINEQITKIPSQADILNNNIEFLDIFNNNDNSNNIGYYNILENALNNIKDKKSELENKKYELEEKKQLLESILKNNKTQKRKFKTINEAYKFINNNIIYDNNNNIHNDDNNNNNEYNDDNNIKKIIIEDSDNISTASSDLSEREFNLINEIIEREHIYNMKILKTYCLFCFYRDITIPDTNDIEKIKNNLDGYKYLPIESLNELNKYELIYYLYVNSSSLEIKLGYGYVTKIKGKYISVYNLELKKKKILNYLNPVFRKVRMDDIN